MNYSKHWDLSTIPESAWASERGRRNGLKGTTAKLRKCTGCTLMLNARQRRKACPGCGTRANRETA